MGNSPLYKKHHSIENFHSSKNQDYLDAQIDRSVALIQAAIESKSLDKRYSQIISYVLNDLLKSTRGQKTDFKIVPFIAEEMETLEDDSVIQYLYHRYRYDVFSQKYVLDEFPPYIQIEPTSFCNLRCVFCYQTDKTFSRSSSGFMGSMTFGLFKEIIDQLEGNVEFISLASRGEPLLCKEIDKMLEYCIGKFLGLKINTNASTLTERQAHAILSGGVKTLVFSVDSTEESLYSKFRVGGNLKKIIKNIEMFQNIRAEQYTQSKLITRVSGVMFDPEKQKIKTMVDFWGSLVDQVSFVKYNPWENIYRSKYNSVTNPCSDLWRRMFIWYNGLVNPCDCDYKSRLAVGNIKEKTVKELWQSKEYDYLREKHLSSGRQGLEPCRRCALT